MPETDQKACQAASELREPAAAKGLDRTLSVVAVLLGVSLALVLGRVVPQSAPARPANGRGVVVIGPIGLVPVAAPALRR